MIHESFEARHSWLNELAQILSKSEKEQVCHALKILTDKAKHFEEPTQVEGKQDHTMQEKP